MRPKTIRTELHVYRFDTTNDKECTDYYALREKIKTTPGRGRSDPFPGTFKPGVRYEYSAGPIVLKTDFLSNDQWNSLPTEHHENGLRVFDWYERNYPNQKLKVGYYLDITQEMIDIRRNTLQCGFCGKFYDEPTPDGMCNACLGSPYLEPELWHLLRLRPISEKYVNDRPKLSEEETQAFRHKYMNEQNRARAERTRAQQKKDLEWVRKGQKDAWREYQSKLMVYNARCWLMDKGLNPREPIYYDHTDRFCWGWEGKLNGGYVADDRVESLMETLKSFPHAFDIKTAPHGKYKGRTLTNKPEEKNGKK